MTIFKRLLLTSLACLAWGLSLPGLAQSDLLGQARAMFKPIPATGQAPSAGT
jgi:hypothetical protein